MDARQAPGGGLPAHFDEGRLHDGTTAFDGRA